jgi:hypothetical protein
MTVYHIKPRICHPVRRRPRRWPSDRWTTDPDAGYQSALGLPPTDADCPAEPVLPYTARDLLEAEILLAQEPAELSLSGWLASAAPEPQEYHGLEERRDFYATMFRLDALAHA